MPDYMVADMTNNQIKVMKFFAERPLFPRTTSEICRAIGVSRGCIDNVLRKLRMKHLWRPYNAETYSMTIDGLKWAEKNLGLMFVYPGVKVMCPRCNGKLRTNKR